MTLTFEQKEEFRKWIHNELGRQDAEYYAGTLTEEIAVMYALHKQKLLQHGISGKQPDYKTISKAARKYSKDVWGYNKGYQYECSVKDFIAAAQWMLSQVAGVPTRSKGKTGE
jgi:hypothetical protein